MLHFKLIFNILPELEVGVQIIQSLLLKLSKGQCTCLTLLLLLLLILVVYWVRRQIRIFTGLQGSLSLIII